MNIPENTFANTTETSFDFTLPPSLTPRQATSLQERLADYQQAGIRESARIEQQVQALQAQYSRQRNQLLGSEKEQLLNDYTQQHRRPEPVQFDLTTLPASQQPSARVDTQRADSISYAQQVGIDLVTLQRLQADYKGQFKALTNSGQLNSSPLTLPVVKAGEQTGSQAVVTPGNALYMPANYAGWWDRNGVAAKSGSGKIMSFAPHLDHLLSRVGNTIWSKNKSASDADYLVSHRENGLMLWHTVPYTARLQVEVDFECVYCQHCIQTWDEFGWSNGDGWTNEAATMAVFWNWEDATPATENIDYNLAWGLGFSGDGEKSPGVKYPVSSGLIRRLTLTTPSQFPAGATVAIYVGARQRFYAWLNDVSINTFVHSQWHLKQINVRNL